MINGNIIRECKGIVKLISQQLFFWRNKIIDATRKFVGHDYLQGVIYLGEIILFNEYTAFS